MNDEISLAKYIDEQFTEVFEVARRAAAAILGANNPACDDVASETLIGLKARSIKKTQEEGEAEVKTRTDWNRIIVSRARKRALDELERCSSEIPPAYDPASEMRAPVEKLTETERDSRREKLFKQVFCDYVCHVEGKNQHLQKEVCERFIHGEKIIQIVVHLGDRLGKDNSERAARYQFECAEKLLGMLFKKYDGNNSVAPTFFARENGRTEVSNSSLPDSSILPSIDHMLGWLKRNGLCPSSTRLQAFANCGSDTGFEDVLFHLYDVQFCGDLSLWARSDKGCLSCRDKLLELAH